MVLLLPKPGHRNPILRGPQNTSHAWVTHRFKKQGNWGLESWLMGRQCRCYCLLSAVSILLARRETLVCQKSKWTAGTSSLQCNPSWHCSRLRSSSQWRSLTIFARAAFYGDTSLHLVPDTSGHPCPGSILHNWDKNKFKSLHVWKDNQSGKSLLRFSSLTKLNQTNHAICICRPR